MKLVLIKDRHFSQLQQLRELYENAFPVKERRNFDDLLTILHEPAMHLHVVMAEKNVIGLSIHWELENILYLEHLAINPEYRCKGAGTKIMRWLLQQTQHQIVLEVERPEDETDQKRINFYEKLGFILHPEFDYQQPPYRPGEKHVPLYLMAQPHIPTQQAFLKIAKLIRQQVYERFYT
ncbi:GNAT family N-acetyltransferase [Pontibacter vulgaris]|uniref:GNAT family N-acetyltransferase n=1 Tax=Pontibacter vulgaris TaxID=2905679 RepID=UPI001FA7C913|nr:GNAT family N-acetyltransferase [Pontibacter vulgaris]